MSGGKKISELQEKTTLAGTEMLVVVDGSGNKKMKASLFKGQKGEQGEPGTPGKAGTDGTNGTNGTDGQSFYAATKAITGGTAAAISDVTVPDGRTLAVGDLIVDTNGNVYRVESKGATNFTPSVKLFGLKGADGKNGTNGTAGSAGKGVKAIALTKDAGGAITGGTVTFTDNSTAAITVTTAAS